MHICETGGGAAARCGGHELAWSGCRLLTALRRWLPLFTTGPTETRMLGPSSPDSHASKLVPRPQHGATPKWLPRRAAERRRCRSCKKMVPIQRNHGRNGPYPRGRPEKISRPKLQWTDFSCPRTAATLRVATLALGVLRSTSSRPASQPRRPAPSAPHTCCDYVQMLTRKKMEGSARPEEVSSG